MNSVLSTEAQAQWNSIIQLRTYFSTPYFQPEYYTFYISLHLQYAFNTVAQKKILSRSKRLFSKAPTPAPRPTTPPIQWISRTLSKGDKVAMALR
jgi:hypothetical protein